MKNPEKERLKISANNTNWKKWGPYLSDRQWGTVREDYSADGNAWNFITHEKARSNAYRWGEEGIGGISDTKQLLCFAPAFWNGKDPFLKERLFGLTGPQGNHGEDVKELYYYLDSTPTHSYMKMLYKYPQQEFPYEGLVFQNQIRNREQPEFELIDTGIFDENKYFDIFIEYAKADIDDILIKITAYNRGKEAAPLAILPTLWFRNYWSYTNPSNKPQLKALSPQALSIQQDELGDMVLYCEQAQEIVFCDNETNTMRVHGVVSRLKYFKDGINDYIVHGNWGAVNPEKTGTKAAAVYRLYVEPEGSVTVRLRLAKAEHGKGIEQPFADFDEIFAIREAEANQFYAEIQRRIKDAELRMIQRQAFAGMMWCKQFFYYHVRTWLEGDPAMPAASSRLNGRNASWKHMVCNDIISMPDKWEYPWFAAWDSAFHCLTIARIDTDFAKEQLLLFLSDGYQHPNGQIPAYEWNFSDVNPPVHAWAVLRVFQIEKKQRNGEGDYEFLERAFHRLMLNFMWWVNRKDSFGKNIFEGGFLGLDNIGVFDRSHGVPAGAKLEQADGTGWMAMYALNMLRIAIELALLKPVYQGMATKFFEHFLLIAEAMNGSSNQPNGLWDIEDDFFYDLLHLPDGSSQQLKIRSVVGIITIFAVETLKSEAYRQLPELREKLRKFLAERPKLSSLVSRYTEPGAGDRRLLAMLRKFRLYKVLQRMLDSQEFLSDYGIRALSKYHEKNPYQIKIGNEILQVAYVPGESNTFMFGGNSNWRGPIWFPINHLIIESLRRFYDYYGDTFKVEYPVGSGKQMNLLEISMHLSERLMNLFKRNEKGIRPALGDQPKIQQDEHFKDYILFYEYFHGDTGKGLGASHQTGWTGLIADIIHKYYTFKEELDKGKKISSLH